MPSLNEIRANVVKNIGAQGKKQKVAPTNAGTKQAMNPVAPANSGKQQAMSAVAPARQAIKPVQRAARKPLLKGPGRTNQFGRKPVVPSGNLFDKKAQLAKNAVGTSQGSTDLVGTGQSQGVQQGKKQNFEAKKGAVVNPEGTIVKTETGTNPSGTVVSGQGQNAVGVPGKVNKSLSGTKNPTTPRRSIRTIQGFKKGGTFTRKDAPETGSLARKARRQKLVNKSNNEKVFKDVMNEQRQRG